MVMDQSAAIPNCNTLGYGYYRYDTRHISHWEMTLNGSPLSLLSSAVNEGYAGIFLYTNPQTEKLPQQKITLQREIVLGDYLWERIILQNFHNSDLELELNMSFGSDFADMFEVRGLNVNERGTRMLPAPGVGGRTLFLGYRGLDDTLVETVIEFFGVLPESITDEGEANFRFTLPMHQTRELQICMSTRIDGHDHVEPGEHEDPFDASDQEKNQHIGNQEQSLRG